MAKDMIYGLCFSKKFDSLDLALDLYSVVFVYKDSTMDSYPVNILDF